MIRELELPYNSLKTPKAIRVPFICHTARTLGGPHFPSSTPLPLRLSHLQLSGPLEGQGDWQGMMMFSSGF